MPEELALDTTSYRKTMGLFATGVTVLTTYNAHGEMIGMTANAVTSVSLEPLLLLVCVWKAANIAPHILESNVFALNILAENQRDLSQYFAGLSDGPIPEFAITEWMGTPYLHGTLAALACHRYEVLEGGDHWIVIGEVIGLQRENTPPAPLIFYRGEYHGLQA